MIVRVRTRSKSAAPPPDGEVPAGGALLPHRLQPPRSLVAPIERRFLIGRIKEGLEGQVVAVHAPAGFGKTVLLTAAFQRLRQPGDRFVWMTLDEADASPVTFLHDLAVAIDLARQKKTARIASSTEEALAIIRAAFLSDPSRLVVFLDDFHVVGGAAFRACMEQVLRRLPHHVRFVIASRRRPDLSLSRLRMRDLLTEIRWSDLAFSRVEVQAMAGPALPLDDIDRSLDMTQGWPALVHLGLPVLLDANDPVARAEILAGTHRLFQEFLDEELLPDLPGDMRNAVAVCSVLDEFPLDLAAELAGIEVGPATMAVIEQIAPMIEPVPHHPGWLRLHPVVRATMRIRADRRPIQGSTALHVRAASWFAQRGILDKAVRHATHGGDFALAAEAIRQAGGVHIFIRAGYKVLNGLLADLPLPVLRGSPSLRLCHALVLSKQGQIQAARDIVDDLKRATGPGPAGAQSIARSDLDHIDGLIDVYEDRWLDDAQIATLQRDAQDYRARDIWERGWIYNHLCIAYQRTGNLSAARLTGLRALACYREEKTPYAQIFMLSHVGTVLIATGRLAAAAKLLADADRLAQETQWSDENIAAVVQIPLATTLYHQGRVREAARLLEIAMPIVAAGEGWVDLYARGFGTLARCKSIIEGLEAGLTVLDSAEVLAKERSLPRLDLSMSLMRAELFMRADLLEPAAHVLEQLPPIGIEDLAGEWPTWRERHEACLVRSRLLTRTGDHQAALALLGALVKAAVGISAGLDDLTGRIAMVESLWATGEPDQALAMLQQAITFAIPQKAVQPFRDGGAPLAAIIRAIMRRFGLSAFRSDMIAFIADATGSVRQIGELATPSLTLLTTREFDVLTGLDSGQGNKAIARDLGLTEAAVKFHLKNLFRKLGVHRRSMAISVARNAGLL